MMGSASTHRPSRSACVYTHRRRRVPRVPRVDVGRARAGEGARACARSGDGFATRRDRARRRCVERAGGVEASDRFARDGCARETDWCARARTQIARVAVVVTAVKTYVADLTLCVGPSMMPTFNPIGDVVVVERASALAGRPTRRGDVVLATSPTNPEQLVFKRAVGLGGDVIDVPVSRGRNFRMTTRRVRVPLGSVWLQGDNARNSTDSRDYGPVPETMLRGRAFVRIWPISGFGFVENSMRDVVLVSSRTE